MPLYEVKCFECSHKENIYRTVEKRDHHLPYCPTHGATMARIISAPFLAPDFEPYVSPGSGAVINSRRQMDYDLKTTGHIIKEPGLDKDIARNKQEQAEKSFAPIASGIDQTVRNLVNSSQIES